MALQVLARAEPHLHGLPEQAPAGQPGGRALLALLDLWLDRWTPGWSPIYCVHATGVTLHADHPKRMLLVHCRCAISGIMGTAVAQEASCAGRYSKAKYHHKVTYQGAPAKWAVALRSAVELP